MSRIALFFAFVGVNRKKWTALLRPCGLCCHLTGPCRATLAMFCHSRFCFPSQRTTVGGFNLSGLRHNSVTLNGNSVTLNGSVLIEWPNRLPLLPNRRELSSTTDDRTCGRYAGHPPPSKNASNTRVPHRRVAPLPPPRNPPHPCITEIEFYLSVVETTPGSFGRADPTGIAVPVGWSASFAAGGPFLV